MLKDKMQWEKVDNLKIYDFFDNFIFLFHLFFIARLGTAHLFLFRSTILLA